MRYLTPKDSYDDPHPDHQHRLHSDPNESWDPLDLQPRTRRRHPGDPDYQDYMASLNRDQYRSNHDQRHFGHQPRVSRQVHPEVGSSAPRPPSGRYSPLRRLDNTSYADDSSSPRPCSSETSSEGNDSSDAPSDSKENSKDKYRTGEDGEVFSVSPRLVVRLFGDASVRHAAQPGVDEGKTGAGKVKRPTPDEELSEILTKLEAVEELKLRQAPLERALQQFKPFCHLEETCSKTHVHEVEFSCETEKQHEAHLNTLTMTKFREAIGVKLLIGAGLRRGKLWKN